MKTDKTPMDVLNNLTDRALLLKMCGSSRYGKVGEMVEKCSPEERELLSQLTSEHTLNIRPDLPEIKYNNSGQTWQEKYL